MVVSVSQLTPGALIEGLDPAGPVAVIQSQTVGSSSVQLTFRRTDGTLDDLIIFSDRLSGLSLAAAGCPTRLRRHRQTVQAGGGSRTHPPCPSV